MWSIFNLRRKNITVETHQNIYTLRIMNKQIDLTLLKTSENWRWLVFFATHSEAQLCCLPSFWWCQIPISAMLSWIQKSCNSFLKLGPDRYVLSTYILPPTWATGYGSTDLRLDISPKLKMVNYWWYWPHHKKKNLYLNYIYKLYLTKIFLKPSYTDILKILEK
jgi:hypothetical protein